MACIIKSMYDYIKYSSCSRLDYILFVVACKNSINSKI
ncbi:hypothetical protein ECHOSC_0887 [Ehrlichia chaffeensis str. Osceola]|nr:hypothetical protein ECHJAX_0172 [Ehrlichia chaffeensis str. Jax]AHX07362.1 hypothetical protein ECHOSC_0887 [Ehrlichia chaffeensis str. Osceola]